MANREDIQKQIQNLETQIKSAKNKVAYLTRKCENLGKVSHAENMKVADALQKWHSGAIHSEGLRQIQDKAMPHAQELGHAQFDIKFIEQQIAKNKTEKKALQEELKKFENIKPTHVSDITN